MKMIWYVVVSLVFTTQTENMIGSPTLPPSTNFRIPRSAYALQSACLCLHIIYVCPG